VIKNVLRKILPTSVLDRRRKRSYSKGLSKYQGWEIQKVFSHIFEENKWGMEETVSGQGSTIHQMGPILHEVEEVFQSLEVRSVLDLPCGDFNWMRHVNLSGIQYIGGDIVPELVKNNQVKYGSEMVAFRLMDLTSDELPKVDMILNKDCFIHFSYEHIYQALQRILASGSKYFMTTTSVNTTVNFDITTGDWRSINLQLAPFHFPEPIFQIKEYCKPGLEKHQRGKTLSVWRVEDIRLPEGGY